MSSPWQKYKDKNGITPFDLIKADRPEAVSEEKYNERMNLCLSCPELIQVTKQCKQCGCFMKLKAVYEPAKCPLGKW